MSSTNPSSAAMNSTCFCPPAPVFPNRRKMKNNAVAPAPTTSEPTMRTITSAF